MLKAYVSSTVKDLAPIRHRASHILRRFDYVDVAMEHNTAEDVRPVDRCLADVAACDLYIGIFAWRYGTQPAADNPEQLSITEMEYRAAGNKPRLLFLLHEDAPWPAALIDEDRTRIRALRARVAGDRQAVFFTSTETFEMALNEALAIRCRAASPFDVSSYFRFLQQRYEYLDLDGLAPRGRRNPLPLLSVFVEPNVREDEPVVELPKDIAYRQDGYEALPTPALPPGVTDEWKRWREEYPVTRAFDALGGDHRRTLILGDPGSGKSSLLQCLLLSLLQPSARLARLAGSIPVLVDVKRYVGLRTTNRAQTVLQYVEHLSREEDSPLGAAALEGLLAAGHPLLILFDGIDEVSDSIERETIIRQMTMLASRNENVRIVATSRLIGYPRSRFAEANFRRWTLLDFDDQQVSEFVAKWYAATGRGGDESVRDVVGRLTRSLTQSTSMRLLAGNPLLLTIMAMVIAGKERALPIDRWELYDHAATILVERWDVQKHLADRGFGDELMSAEDRKELLRRLAFAMQSEDGPAARNYVDGHELQERFETYLQERYTMPRDRAAVVARRMIVQFHERNFILVFYGEPLYGFVHRAFLEFFCASSIVTRFAKGQLSADELRRMFAAHADDPSWHDVLQMICGQVGNRVAGELIDELISPAHPPTDAALKLAIECFAALPDLKQISGPSLRLLQCLCRRIRQDVSRDSFREVLSLAGKIGVRWPGREWLAEWLRDRERTRNTYVSAGTFVGTLIAGLESGHTILRRRADDDPLATWALAQAWGHETAEVEHLISIAERGPGTDATSMAAIEALATHCSTHLAARDALFRFASDQGRSYTTQQAILKARVADERTATVIKLVHAQRGVSHSLLEACAAFPDDPDIRAIVDSARRT